MSTLSRVPFVRRSYLVATASLFTIALSIGAQQSESPPGAALPDGRLLRAGTDTMYIAVGADSIHARPIGLAVSEITRTPDHHRLTLLYTQIQYGRPASRVETVVDNRTLMPLKQLLSRGDTVVLTLTYRADGVLWERHAPGQPIVVSGPFAVARGAYSATINDEVIRALPLRSGFHAELPFYYFGLQRRLTADISVRGSDTIRTRSGQPVDCWVVSVATESPVGNMTFWIDKATRDLIRVTDSHERYER